MAISLSDIKDISAIAKPFIEPLVTTFITPYIKRVEKWLTEKGVEKKVIAGFIEKKFDEYLERAYQNFSSINILVFPNQQINIKEIYVPLSIVCTKDRDTYKIDSFDNEILKKYKRILISDSAGMGKSTLLKWIGLKLIEENLSIPILVELKRLTTDNKLIDEIFKQINPLDKSFDRELIYKFLEFGQFTILLDGFDEIQHSYRSNVIDDIKDFISKTSKNGMLMTSRREDSLSSFGNFQLFEIKPLELSDSFKLIEKYDGFGKLQIKDKLIEDIKEKLKQVKEFLVNPFLVSLLYKTYTYNKDIPSKKSTFYDEVYAALYKHHDLSKDHFERNKVSGLDIYDFRLVLRQLAFDTAKVIKVEYTNSEILNFISIAKNGCGINFKPEHYLTDLENNVPLFVKDGILSKWGHKSLQDYFAAEWISSSPRKEEILSKIFNSGKRNYLNILDFLSELEPKLFRKVIVYAILKSFVNYCENSYQNVKGVDLSLIRYRQAYTFSNGYINLAQPRLDWDTVDELFNRLCPGFNLMYIQYNNSQNSSKNEAIGTSYYSEIISLFENTYPEIFLKQSISSRKAKLTLQFKPDTSYVLNDDNPKSIFNLPLNFEKVNKYVRGRVNTLLLDYEKCLSLIEKIKVEVITENETNILENI